MRPIEAPPGRTPLKLSGGECSGRQIVGPPRRCGSSKVFWENQWFPARGARNQ